MSLELFVHKMSAAHDILILKLTFNLSARSNILNVSQKLLFKLDVSQKLLFKLDVVSIIEIIQTAF